MPRLTSLSGAQVAVLFDDPLGIVEFDEVADGVPQLRDVAVDATMDDLFLQRAIERSATPLVWGSATKA